MRVLLTGGAGYLGSVITDCLLVSGYEVVVLDLLWFEKNVPLIFLNNPRYYFYNLSFSDEAVGDLLEEVDYVIHAAAVVGEPASKKFPELTKKINYEDTLKFIKECEKRKVKGFIFISTCSSYGISDGVADETSSLNPLSLYAETKVDVENFILSGKLNVDWIICRLATLYGLSPRMRFDLTVNEFVAKAYFEKYIDIYLPNSYRPYIHVYDAAQIICKILQNFEKIKNNVFNVGFNEQNYKKMEIVEVIKRYIPDLKVEVIRKGEDRRNYRVDFSKIKKSIEVKSLYSVEKAVKQIIGLFENKVVVDYKDRKYYNIFPDL